MPRIRKTKPVGGNLVFFSLGISESLINDFLITNNIKSTEAKVMTTLDNVCVRIPEVSGELTVPDHLYVWLSEGTV